MALESKEEKIMKCNVCGAELGVEEKVCHECGNPVSTQEPSGAGAAGEGMQEGSGETGSLDGATSLDGTGEPPRSGKKKGLIIGGVVVGVAAVGALAFGLMGRKDPKEVVISAFENVYTEDQAQPLEELFGLSMFSENALTGDVEDSFTLILDDCSEAEVKALAGSGVRVSAKSDKTNKKSSADIALIYKDMDFINVDAYYGDEELMMAFPELSSKVFTIDLGEGLAQRIQDSPLVGPILEESGMDVEGLFGYFEEQLELAESGKANLDFDSLMTRYREGTQAQEKFKEALSVEKGEKGTFTMDGAEVTCNGYKVLVSKDSMMEFLRTTTDFFLNDEELKEQFLNQLEQSVKLTEMMGGASSGVSAQQLYADSLEDVTEAVNDMVDFLDKSLTDVNMTVYVDKKGRLAAVDGSTYLIDPDAVEEGDVTDEDKLQVTFNCRLQGGSYLTQNMTAEAVLGREGDDLKISMVKGGSYDGKQLTGDLALNLKLDSDEKIDAGFTCTGSYQADGGDYHMGMAVTADDSLLVDLSMSGVVDQLEKGTSIHADIDELKITVMDAMAQLTLSGDYGYGPLSGQVTALQGDAFDILAADEADWESVIMEVYMNVTQLMSQLSY